MSSFRIPTVRGKQNPAYLNTEQFSALCYVIGLPKRTETTWFIFMRIFITDTNQVCTITNTFINLQSGGVFNEHAELTGPQYKHKYVFTCWMLIIVILTRLMRELLAAT